MSKFLLVCLLLATPALAAEVTAPVPTSKPWYERISVSGYADLRYNRLLETNRNYKCPQCDASIDDNGGFFFPRARLVLQSQVQDHVFVKVEPDFAQPLSSALSSTFTGMNESFVQMRDFYADISIDPAREFRFRVGQCKVPYGFENMQSSGLRIAFDRTDALNSAIPNERDIGVFFYWAPAEIRERFKLLIGQNLKGTGDYGVVGLGVYNGQSQNRPENNNNKHVVAHLTYPWKLGEQFVETSVHAYSGLFGVTRSSSAVALSPDAGIDRRVAGSLVVYPQPIGFAAEYNTGDSPTYDAGLNEVVNANVHGGYAQVMYQAEKIVGASFIPYVRSQYFRGGKKHEIDARFYRVTEHEAGIEYQPWPALELTVAYAVGNRFSSDAANRSNEQHGQFLRTQAQFNF